MRTNALYMPKPSSSAAAFVVQTAGSRIIFMSTSGCRERLSALTHAAASRAAMTKRPSVFVDPQCHVGPSLTATSNATSQAESSAPPSQWMLPGARLVDSGMKRIAATAATDVTASGIQNSQWYDRWSTTGPAITMPRPLPMPIIADRMPIAPATRRCGNSSRMIPKLSGKTAAPNP